MTMHLLPIYFTTTKHSRKRKRKFSQKQQKAQQEHEKFLKKMGVTGAVSNKGIHDIPDYKADIRKTAKLLIQFQIMGLAKEPSSTQAPLYKVLQLCINLILFQLLRRAIQKIMQQ